MKASQSIPPWDAYIFDGKCGPTLTTAVNRTSQLVYHAGNFLNFSRKWLFINNLQDPYSQRASLSTAQWRSLQHC